MSTPFLLTRIADGSSNLIKLVKKLKKQDASCAIWDNGEIEKLEDLLSSMKADAEKRRTEVLQTSGKDAAAYKF